MTDPVRAARLTAIAEQVAGYDRDGYDYFTFPLDDLRFLLAHVETLEREKAELTADLSALSEDYGNLLTASNRFEQQRDAAHAALKRCKPVHYAGECGHCGMDELPPAECPTLKLIAEVNAALAASAPQKEE
jgi:DNA repair exonuclease SbcCD ATPase subunit